MNKKSIFGLVFIALIAFCWWDYESHGVKQTSKVTNVGSTALQPLSESAAAGFLKKNPVINLIVQGGGSGMGLSQVQNGTVEIGSSDVYAESKKGINAKKLTDHIVAISAIVPIVNKKLNIKNLTTNQLRDIFLGTITNWKQVGGPDLEITIINRASGSGTRAAFQELILKGKEPLKAQEQDSNGSVKQIVKATPGAISYVSTSYIDNSIKTLTIDGIDASSKNVETNKYKLWSYEHMYTQKNASAAAVKFIEYIQSKEVQNTLVKRAHYISIYDMKVVRDINGVVRKK